MNSEAEQVEAEERRWDKEHDGWWMLQEIEEDDEGNVRVAEHGMMKVMLNVDMSH